MRRATFIILILAFASSCAGVQRGFASCNAEAFGANWVVVQVDCSGRPYRCWVLTNVSITNEENSDGIYWKDGHGNLIHIAGQYNRVQVIGNNWNVAYESLGLTTESCKTIQNKKVVP